MSEPWQIKLTTSKTKPNISYFIFLSEPCRVTSDGVATPINNE